MFRQGVPHNDFGTIARNNRAGLGTGVAPTESCITEQGGTGADGRQP
jgi:hypothetical protein